MMWCGIYIPLNLETYQDKKNYYPLLLNKSYNNLLFFHKIFDMLKNVSKLKTRVVKHGRLRWNSWRWNYYDTYGSCRNTEHPEEKNSILDSTEIPDRENTVFCTNLIEPLNLLHRKRIVGMRINVFSAVIKT